MSAAEAAAPTPEVAGQAPATRRVPGRLQTILVLVITAVVIGGAAVILSGSSQSDSLTQVNLTADVANTAPTVGSVPPAFSALTYDGKTVNLADYAGKPLWLTFGASWCPDCRAEAPDVEAAYNKYQAQGLNLLAVFISESAADVAGYAGRAGLTFPIAVDQNTKIASAYRTMGIPTHFFIGADGKIKDVKIGALDPATIESEIQTILGK
jgi:cytochrome c biogenesis protein CcmG, thiol:disulfide interchange protein DsbE